MHVRLYAFTSHPIPSHHIISHHITSYHLASPHIPSHHNHNHITSRHVSRSHFGSSSARSHRGTSFLASLSGLPPPAMVMICPVCLEWRLAREWSPVQKMMRDPRASGCDGWERNCCKHCQDVPGWYYTTCGAVAQPPAQPRPVPRHRPVPSPPSFSFLQLPS